MTPGESAPTGVGSQRRVQALMARSWSAEAIGEASGIRADDVRVALERPAAISPDLAGRIAKAYDALWSTQPPCATPQQRARANAAPAQARRSGWAPPLGWDDDQLDAPDGKPAEAWQRSSRRTIPEVELGEDAQFVREHGGYRHESVAAVAMRLAVRRDRLEQALRRDGVRRSSAEPELEAG